MNQPVSTAKIDESTELTQAADSSLHHIAHVQAIQQTLFRIIADIALGYGLATSTSPPTSMVTANLSVDFAGSAATCAITRSCSRSRASTV